MAKHKQTQEEVVRKDRRAARTLSGRENQLIDLAVSLAEKQIRDGTASSQVLVHYLKLGTTREILEKERLEAVNSLLLAKVESLKSGAELKDLYEEAIKAMTRYSGNKDVEDDG